MLDNEEKPLNTVPEVWLRKRKALDKEKRAANIRRKFEIKRSEKKSLVTEFDSLHQVLNHRRNESKEKNRVHKINKRISKGKLVISKDQQNKLLLVIRLDTSYHRRTVIGAAESTLHKLGVGRYHSAAFVRNTPDVQEKLAIVKNYVIYGEPTLETVRNLINKRAYTIIKGERVAITDNNMVEEALGDEGIICIEDIIHEIINGDIETFNKVNNFLAPFQLSRDGHSKNKVELKKMQEKADGQKSVMKNVNKYIEYYN
ncbi:ribosomal protein L30, ferredoxin-like fold domain-containing protein [Cunninghamella echinulata]|nr:ribosomal protein L30, ferredoxin-like fold domain-containing protein [Cunninghamella echinulata]